MEPDDELTNLQGLNRNLQGLDHSVPYELNEDNLYDVSDRGLESREGSDPEDKAGLSDDDDMHDQEEPDVNQLFKYDAQEDPSKPDDEGNAAVLEEDQKERSDSEQEDVRDLEEDEAQAKYDLPPVTVNTSYYMLQVCQYAKLQRL